METESLLMAENLPEMTRKELIVYIFKHRNDEEKVRVAIAETRSSKLDKSTSRYTIRRRTTNYSIFNVQNAIKLAVNDFST